MPVDLRLKHDRLLGEQAVETFERGLGYRSATKSLGVPAEAARNWLKTYRAIGRDGLLAMGGKQARYDYETKVAAASAVVDGGMSKPEAQVACLKKIDSLEGGEALPNREKALAVAELSGLGHKASDLLEADGPWQKMGTGVTEFKLSFGKAYLAPVYDFGSKEIVVHSISLHPDLAQQEEMLEMLMEAKPEGTEPILHSDMGWRYQHAVYVGALAGNGFVQSMSRKGNRIDNGATEQVFGHIEDEFFRGQDWETFESLKADLDAYIMHWNTKGRQAKLKGLTPAEFRDQALREAA